MSKKTVIPVEVGQIRIDPHRWEGHGDTKREVEVIAIFRSDVTIQTVNAQRLGRRLQLLGWPVVKVNKSRIERWPVKS